MNKKKIINDPVYGFLHIHSELIYDIIQHPYFQRLRHIRQLGLAYLIYPGAMHTRFQHALGAMHLMARALENLRHKKIDVSAEEMEAAQIAVLLHDLGHGPFSHALEESLLNEVKHESLSYLFMDRLNREFNGALELSLKIFRNSYHRKFFHQLVSSQLDMDRLDYLKRDCFFTGVEEGTIGVDRIIAMLTVRNDELMVEEKGIYSIENFLTARRLMYWQVYLHKTSVAAERMLVNLIRRARHLAHSGESIHASRSLKLFLAKSHTMEDFTANPDVLTHFGGLDDNDIWGAIKEWQYSGDKILAELATSLIQRRLFKIQFSSDVVRREDIDRVREAVSLHYDLLRAEAPYLFSHGHVSNEAYTSGQAIHVLMKTGEVLDIAQASDLPNIRALSKTVKKNYLCWPKNVSL